MSKDPNPLPAILLALLAALMAAPAWGYNIEITGVEISQGIQNMDNEMPLVMGRRMIIRTYARVTTGETIPDVQARVLVSWSYQTLGGGLGGGGGGGGLNLDSEPATLTGASPSRLDYAGSLNTIVDIGIPNGIDPDQPIDLTVEVIVNHADLGEEDNATDNTMLIETEMQVPNPLGLKFVPVHLHEPSGPASDAQLWDNPIALKFIFAPLRHHPVALDRFQFTWTNVPVEPLGHGSGTEWNMAAGSTWTEIIERLETRHMMEGQPATTVMSGMVSTTASGGSNPRGKAQGNAMWQVMNSTLHTAGVDWYYDGPGVLAHELGHIRGVEHVDCNGSEENPDGDYPWPSGPGGQCQLADVDEDGYYGLGVYSYLLGPPVPATISNDNGESSPHRGWPLMGYWRPMWVSPYEFCRMMNFGYGMDCNLSWPMPQGGGLVPPSVDQLLNADEHVWIGGLLDTIRDRVILPPFYRWSDASENLLGQAVERRIREADSGLATRYSIVLKDAGDNVLYEHPIYDLAGGDSVSDRLVLNDLLPFPSGTAAIALLADGETMDERTVSPAAPSVQLVMPSTPDLGVGDVISWQASDADGGPELSYTVLYGFDVVDGGDVTTVWETLKLETRDAELTLTDDMVASLGGDSGRIKVVVSDGVNTGEAVSGTYQTPNPPPKAVILNAPFAPAASASPIVLEGLGVDRDEGILPREALTWSSDVDGALGSGPRIETSLSRGVHLITLTVEDRYGATAQATAELTISR